MKTRTRQYGLSLTEILTTLMIIVLLAAMSMPAVNAIFNSLGSAGSCEAMINAALSNARAIAMREQRYAGVRFQNAYNPDNPLGAEQYMIFIIQDPELTGTYGYGFRAVQGMKPIKLPQNIGVMDFTIVIGNNQNNPVNPNNEIHIDDPAVNADNLLKDPKNLSDIGTFSIIFSPTGNLVVHGVRVWQASSADDVFNTAVNVKSGIGMFYIDDYYGATSPYVNLGPEPSRRKFYIYEQDKFKSAYELSQAYSGYLSSLAAKPIYLNSYTGTIISVGQ